MTEYYNYSLHYTEVADGLEISKDVRDADGNLKRIWTKVCLLNDERFDDLWKEKPYLDHREVDLEMSDIPEWATSVISYVVDNINTKFGPEEDFPYIDRNVRSGEFGSLSGMGWQYKEDFLCNIMASCCPKQEVEFIKDEYVVVEIEKFPLFNSLSYEACELLIKGWAELYNFQHTMTYVIFIADKMMAFDVTTQESCARADEYLQKYYGEVDDEE